MNQSFIKNNSLVTGVQLVAFPFHRMVRLAKIHVRMSQVSLIRRACPTSSSCKVCRASDCLALINQCVRDMPTRLSNNLGCNYLVYVEMKSVESDNKMINFSLLLQTLMTTTAEIQSRRQKLLADVCARIGLQPSNNSRYSRALTFAESRLRYVYCMVPKVIN